MSDSHWFWPLYSLLSINFYIIASRFLSLVRCFYVPHRSMANPKAPSLPWGHVFPNRQMSLESSLTSDSAAKNSIGVDTPPGLFPSTPECDPSPSTGSLGRTGGRAWKETFLSLKSVSIRGVVGVFDALGFLLMNFPFVIHRCFSADSIKMTQLLYYSFGAGFMLPPLHNLPASIAESPQAAGGLMPQADIKWWHDTPDKPGVLG